MPRLFVDLDGVMADFDAHYAATIAPLPDRWRTDYDHDAKDEVEWEKIDKQKFYSTIPLMRDAMVLWDYVYRHNPTILTGVPKIGFEQAAANKREWVAKNLGPDVPVITCRSRDKCLHAEAGDVLVDDWEKYKPMWVAKGGVWVTHVTAARTVSLLSGLGL